MPRKRILTPEEARRAIYIDFEAIPTESPALLGICYAEGRKVLESRLVVRHVIADKALAAVVDAPRLGSVYRHEVDASTTLKAAIAELCRLSSKQRRPIVCWSHFDKEQIAEHVGSAYNQRILNKWWCDAKATAQEWRKALAPDMELERTRSGRHRLTAYMEAFGYQHPANYGPGQVPTRIRSVRDGLSNSPNWRGLSEARKAQWLALIDHNVSDLVGMRRVAIDAADQLATVERPSNLGIERAKTV